ncbi:MAG: hypothetical protein MK096_10620 [Oleiphilaceae bacterium]|nr:hypothetical protein [Oleiphilaceae bacterium]
MKLKLLSAAILSISSVTAHAGSFALVTNGDDSGKGSLRDALESQKARTVYIMPGVNMIELSDTLNYDSQKSLRIFGSGQTVKLPKNATLLSINEGANLAISDLTLEGLVDTYSIENRADLNGELAGKGIFIDVRDDQTGTVSLSLKNVTVQGFANHGVHVSDCSLSDACGAGSGGAGEGSDASIQVTMINSTINDVGNGKFDADGLRVDDRGAGDIIFYSRNSTFQNVGADGVELDEGNDGSIYADVVRSQFLSNGAYCDPALFPGVEADGEFEPGELMEADLAIPSGSLDDTCIEIAIDLYEDGSIKEYEFALDLDDGIDLDEAGDGSIYSFMSKSLISLNLDEGVDYDEAGNGGIDAAFIRNRGIENNDDAFKMSEEDAGDLSVFVRRTDAFNNGGEGFTFEEEGEGNVDAFVIRVNTARNKKENKDGLEVVQEDEGQGTLRLIRSNIEDGIKLEGVELK